MAENQKTSIGSQLDETLTGQKTEIEKLKKQVSDLGDEVKSSKSEILAALDGKLGDLQDSLSKQIEISTSKSLNKFWMGTVVVAGVLVATITFINNSNQAVSSQQQNLFESASTQALLREIIRAELSANQQSMKPIPAPEKPVSASTP